MPIKFSESEQKSDFSLLQKNPSIVNCERIDFQFYM